MTFLNCSRNFENHQFEGFWCDTDDENRWCSTRFECEDNAHRASHFLNDLSLTHPNLASDLFEFMRNRLT